jgi:hypothetical protein
MKHIIITLALIAGIAQAGEYYKVNANGAVAKSLSFRQTPKPHVLGPDEFPKDAVLPFNVDCKYWKRSANTWVEMDAAEKAVVDDEVKDKKVDVAAIKDELLQALCEVCADEFGLTVKQLEQKMKAKLK